MIRKHAPNAIALKFIPPFGIPVDDLNALVAAHPEHHDYYVVHFNAKGVDVQAAQVVAEIVTASKLLGNSLAQMLETCVPCFAMTVLVDFFRQTLEVTAISLGASGFFGFCGLLSVSLERGHNRGVRRIFKGYQDPLLLCKRAVSSAVERLAYTELVGGSIPSLPSPL